MEIGIVGYGVLGKALKYVFEGRFKIHIYDKFQEEYKDITPVVKNSELIFVGVPTPMKENGEIDLVCVEDALKTISDSVKIQSLKKKPIVVLRSTVIPGTTEKLQKRYPLICIVFNPEFLTEKNFLSDMKNTDRIVIGSSNKNSLKTVKETYMRIFPKAKYILTETKAAEMIKYASNVTLASQIMIANELYQICKKLKIDYNTIKETLLIDKRIGRNINVPGPDGSLGFGGKCFPKDLNALIKLAKQKGYNPELLEQVWRTNLKIRKNQDWKRIKGATSANGFKSI
jgi:UDPglucose 6-dehydrogenase